VDLGILTRVEQVWTSGQYRRLRPPAHPGRISYAYAPKAMMAWVTDVPNMQRALDGRSNTVFWRR